MRDAALRIGRAENDRHRDALRELERRILYPYGTDRFHIDHGDEPFAFFRGLGKHVHFVAHVGDQLVGSVATVERDTPQGRAWYVADLKTDPAFRDVRIPLRLLSAANDVMNGGALYAISMNPPRGAPNTLVRALLRRAAGMKTATTLGIWTIRYDSFTEYREAMEAMCGPIRCRSLRGIKDIVLESTGEPMPLIHLEHGALADVRQSAPASTSSEHMFCAPNESALFAFARRTWGEPQATATVIERSFDVGDAQWILTSQI